MKIGDLVQLTGFPSEWDLTHEAKSTGLFVGYKGTVLMYHPDTDKLVLVSKDNGISHIFYNGNNAGWWIYKKYLKVLPRQMEFSFMKEKE